MKFTNLKIKNFRNFEEVDVELSNKNVVFGMNDVGKTNFLHAIRFLLDSSVRKNGFEASDFFQYNFSKNIEIILTISIEDFDYSENSQNVVSKIKGGRKTNTKDTVFIKLIGSYLAEDDLGNIELTWGTDIDNLEPIGQRGLQTELDKLFEVIYIDTSLNLDYLISKNRRKLFNENEMSEQDKNIVGSINNLTNNMNEKIADMELVKTFQNGLSDEYHKLRNEKVGIKIKSELSVNGFFKYMKPYLEKEGDSNVYPTSGDGRRKLLSYSVLNYLINNNNTNKIIIYMIEEPENNLHRSMQIALSKQLFSQNIYENFFVSTHSPELLYEMDKANLIRIYSEDKTNCKSVLYQVKEEFILLKKELNQWLTSAIFADRVLLIEGPSEKVLFEYILGLLYPTYELDGGFLLVTNGIKIKPYYDTLTELGIKVIVKTDNDLKAKSNNKNLFDAIGFNRCMELCNIGKKQDAITMPENSSKVDLRDRREKLYVDLEPLRNTFIEKNIFISRLDLENDLYEVLGNFMDQHKWSVNKLQSHKLLNMIEFVNLLNKEECEQIIKHPNFAALKELVKDNEK